MKMKKVSFENPDHAPLVMEALVEKLEGEIEFLESRVEALEAQREALLDILTEKCKAGHRSALCVSADVESETETEEQDD